jgi:hypothetical protein
MSSSVKKFKVELKSIKIDRGAVLGSVVKGSIAENGTFQQRLWLISWYLLTWSLL